MQTTPELRTFPVYSVYKGKCACTIKPIAPTFSVSGGMYRTVSRDGALLFEFAPAGSQPREYEWSKKATFSLSPTECGEICRLNEAIGTPINFIHDPNMLGPESGKITKQMKWTPAPEGNGIFLSITVADKNANQGPVTYSLPLTWGEVEVMKSIAGYCIPHFLGFDKGWNDAAMTKDGGFSNGGDRYPSQQPQQPQDYGWNNY